MTLALICGQGHLPRIVADAQTQRPRICVLNGFEPESLVADQTFFLENLGSLLIDLKARGVTQVCLCGAIRRPPIDPSRLDAATAPLVPRLQMALTSGDDGALRIVMEIFEEAGLEIMAVDQLVPDLLPRAGVVTLKAHSDQNRADARLGEETVAAMGARDMGQACVVQSATVVAREDASGTDEMLLRLARDLGRNIEERSSSQTVLDRDMFSQSHADAPGLAVDQPSPPKGGILFKAPKPGQDRRADLPVIGLDTPDAVASAGLSGIVIEAGGVIILERAKTVARCDALGLFLWVREKGS